MHIITKDNNMDEHNNKRGHTNIIKHENTQDAKQDGPRAQDKMRIGLRLDIKQGNAQGTKRA